MPVPFDPGYADEPFRTLVQDVPDATVFPTKDFRTEWGPVFHRGRLDGTAKLVSWILMWWKPAQSLTSAAVQLPPERASDGVIFQGW